MGILFSDAQRHCLFTAGIGVLYFRRDRLGKWPRLGYLCSLTVTQHQKKKKKKVIIIQLSAD